MNPFLFIPFSLQAVSAFAPICNPIQCAWGQKAFSGYLGEDKKTWEVQYGVTGGLAKSMGSQTTGLTLRSGIPE